MIFQYTHEKIFRPINPKTQTLRLWKPGDICFDGRGFDFLSNDPPLFACISEIRRNGRRWHYKDQVISIQTGRNQKAIGKAKITRLQFIRPRALPDEMILAEGFESRDEFNETWIKIHGKKSFQDNDLVYAITFKTLSEETS